MALAKFRAVAPGFGVVDPLESAAGVSRTPASCASPMEKDGEL